MEYYYEQELNEFSDLRHIEWLANHLEEYTYTEQGQKIREELLNAIKKKNTFYDVCETSYVEFIENFNNNPYDYQTGILVKHDIETAMPMNYFVPWIVNGTKYTVPVGYLMEKMEDYDYRRARSIVTDHWNQSRKECTDVFNHISKIREQGRTYMRFIQGIFEKYASSRKAKSTSKDQVLLRSYGNELRIDVVVCFILSLVYLYCLRESGLIELVRMILGGEIQQAVSMLNGNIKFIIRIIGMLYIGKVIVSFAVKVFWKTFVLKRLTQMNKYREETLEYDAVFKRINLTLISNIDESALLEKHEYEKDICSALRHSTKRFSSNYLKKNRIEQYPYLYRNIRKGLFWYIPISILIILLL